MAIEPSSFRNGAHVGLLSLAHLISWSHGPLYTSWSVAGPWNRREDR